MSSVVGDKLAEIDSLIVWESFRIIFESIYFNRTVYLGRPEADVVIMFKVLVLRQFMVFQT